MKRYSKLHMRKKILEYQLGDNSISAKDIDPSTVIGYKNCYNRYVKRCIDFTLGIILFICILPIYSIIAIAIFLEDGYPVLYRAERGGYKGVPFRIYKFRSMIRNADKIGGGTTALNDRRITKIGNIIRKLKMDEIPNLLNVIKGEMSFIGPRPELTKYTGQYQGTEKLIMEVRPGMTDYSSIEFINLDEIVGEKEADKIYEEYVLPRKNKLRIKYAATVCFRTDIKIFIITIYKVLEKGLNFLCKGKI